MIQLFNQLTVPYPTNVTTLCGNNGNWGYAHLNAVILAPGQKYNITPQNPGYMVLNLGYYTTSLQTYSSPSSPNWYYLGFNLNDYNEYISNSDIRFYIIPSTGWNNLATAYTYVDSNGFVIDLTELPPQYAVTLGLLKFDYVEKFTTATQNVQGYTLTYYAYGMSTALNPSFSLSGANSAQVNTSTFLGIPVNNNIKLEFTNWTMGYQFNYNFLINDEVVSNNAFTYPTDQANVVSMPQNTNILIQSNGNIGASIGTTTLNVFGSPQNISYYSAITYTNNSTPTLISATGSNGASGIPNTNAIAASDIVLELPNYAPGSYTLKSLYNNDGYNDVWVYSQSVSICSPNQTESYVFPPFFTPVNTNSTSYFLQFNSSSPDIIFQYIAQAPVVQVTTTTSYSVTTSSTSTTQSSTTPTTQNSTTTTQQNVTSTTTTTVTNQIITALANPIVALILALALVGLALFVFV